MTKQVWSSQAQEIVVQGTGIRCFVAQHQPKIFYFPFQVVIAKKCRRILSPVLSQSLITRGRTFGYCTASQAISGDDAAFHWRNDVNAERLEPLQENRATF